MLPTSSFPALKHVMDYGHLCDWLRPAKSNAKHSGVISLQSELFVLKFNAYYFYSSKNLEGGVLGTRM